MSYQDIDRRNAGLIGGIKHTSGSFDQHAVPYQYAGDYDSETRVQFPYESQWIQITATTSDVVKYAFRNGGTGGSNYGAVAGASTGPVLYVKASEIYVLNDAAITVGMSSALSGSNKYNLDTRY
jgi:hypothetical protein